MEDAETHPWELVRSAHAILLQQIESGRASWENFHNREAIRRSHIHGPSAAAARLAKRALKTPAPPKSPAPAQTGSFNPTAVVMAEQRGQVWPGLQRQGLS
jgi:hypothetical protein